VKGARLVSADTELAQDFFVSDQWFATAFPPLRFFGGDLLMRRQRLLVRRRR
jgi:hypothetical protein